MVLALDLIALVGAMCAAWLWFLSSQRRVRRLAHGETIDAADLNRLVVSINRTQLLNSRAALASAISALAVAARFVLDIWF